ncbi:ribosomal protein S18-alanine N-acetyltransferase [Aestuariibacter sp. AA17]|uniref:Ribosomal protein S18-alanine N-acetyltransferase n=1 Tax=Fluctibacter corallii TaxID=2984329 RepID=A0ABT3ABV6_9ALTE|nr:ribosomal protein S18-alanine N-acetyltransferase [Aestuariibacter sp. AA17]MCV2886082.1 ribosomal protein S18-alanine N-acetyltransferase [Aestuariibacter sp. AA17]
MLITTLSEKHIVQMYNLHVQCHSNPWSLSTFTDCTTPPYFAAALSVSEQKASDTTAESFIAGYYIGLNVVGEVTLMDIGIAQDYRGKGYGEQLLDAFLARCRQLQCQAIWLEVRASNQAAISLYMKKGFEEIEVRKGYYTISSTRNGEDGVTGKEDAVIMKLSLTD